MLFYFLEFGFYQGANTVLTPTGYICYYCPYNTDDENQYLRHGVRDHLYLPLFPNEGDLKRHNLPPQGKSWEKSHITVEEANRRLRTWAEKTKNKRRAIATPIKIPVKVGDQQNIRIVG